MTQLISFDEGDDADVTYYHYCRDHNGNLVPVDLAKRGRRIVPVFPREISEPYWLPEEESTPDYYELVEEVCQNLNPSQTYLKF
jgi:hypothetical protein